MISKSWGMLVVHFDWINYQCKCVGLLDEYDGIVTKVIASRFVLKKTMPRLCNLIFFFSIVWRTYTRNKCMVWKITVEIIGVDETCINKIGSNYFYKIKCKRRELTTGFSEHLSWWKQICILPPPPCAKRIVIAI